MIHVIGDKQGPYIRLLTGTFIVIYVTLSALHEPNEYRQTLAHSDFQRKCENDVCLWRHIYNKKEYTEHKNGQVTSAVWKVLSN